MELSSSTIKIFCFSAMLPPFYYLPMFNILKFSRPALFFNLYRNLSSSCFFFFHRLFIS
jgi:hypothetical protein